MITKQVNGGKLKKLASNAYVADGNTHAEGGIKLKNAEIEDKEVIINDTDSTHVYSSVLGYAPIAKKLLKAKGESELEIAKLGKDVSKINDNKSLDSIKKNTNSRKVEIKSLQTKQNLEKINNIDNALTQLLDIQELEKQHRGLGQPYNEDGLPKQVSGGTVAAGAASGAATGLGVGAALAPFTAGLSIPIGAALGTIVGGITSWWGASDAEDAAEKQRREAETLAEKQRQEHLANMRAYTAATDKIFAQYKPTVLGAATYKGLQTQTVAKYGGDIPKFKLGAKDTKPIFEDDGTVRKNTNTVTTTNDNTTNNTARRTSVTGNVNADKSLGKTTNETPTETIINRRITTPTTSTNTTQEQRNQAFVTAKAFNYKSTDINPADLTGIQGTYNISKDLAKIANSDNYTSDVSNPSLAKAETIDASMTEQGTAFDATTQNMQATLAKSQLNQIGYDVNAQQAAIQANKAATNRMIMGNTSNSSTARALAMQSGVQSSLAEAQVLENKTNQEINQRSQNTAILNQTEQFNVTSQNQTNALNTQSANQASLANAANKSNVSLANAQALNQSTQFNASMKTNVNLANAQATNQASQFNINAANQASQFNISQQNQINQANVGTNLEREKFNASTALEQAKYTADTKNQATLYNAQSANQASQFNASQNAAAEQFNVGQTNNWNLTGTQLDVQQNQYLTNAKLNVTDKTYLAKYGGNIPKLGYGGIIDQYYGNLLSASTNYNSYMVQRAQKSEEDLRNTIQNIGNMAMTLSLQQMKLPGYGQTPMTNGQVLSPIQSKIPQINNSKLYNSKLAMPNTMSIQDEDMYNNMFSNYNWFK